ncbi:amino acid adenylation domain-containing protein [Nocardia sp. NPDC050710]|uniref:amino acid adenylation domain-containing protein n=1 Tax=Nocardia sp. NPDC050710 TaxID=3157220 RepID=UPI0033F9B862
MKTGNAGESARINTADLTAEQKRELLKQLLQARAERGADRLLSHGERGLWLHSQLAPQSASYNLVYAGRARGTLDLDRLRTALDTLTARHDTLRTTYDTTADGAVASVRPQRRVPLEVVEASGWHSQRVNGWLDRRLQRPIDLRTGPLLEAHVLRLGPGNDVFVLAIAHIAVDFWSLDVLLTELAMIYTDAEVVLPQVEHAYADYVRWQAQLLEGSRGQELRDYWSGRLSGVPRLALPIARDRPLNQTFVGDVHEFEIDDHRTSRLRALARTEGVTLQITMLAAFAAVLHRYSGSEDIIIGSPIAGRGMPRAERMVGYFVNAVGLRAELGGRPSFRTLLQRLRGTVLEAVEHQDFPFLELASHLEPVRDPSYPPVFQVFFAWETSRSTMGEAAVGELELETVTLRQGGAPVDLMLMVAERAHTLTAVLQYNTDLFDSRAVSRLAEHLGILLDGVLAEPDERVGRIPMLTTAEESSLARWNDTGDPRFAGRKLNDLLAGQTRRTPHATAVTFRGEHLTYRELRQRAENLAAGLQAAGVGPGDVVGIAVERSELSVVAPYAVLLAGAAFLPVDPEHPATRLSAIATEANITAWIATKGTAERVPGALPVVTADTEGPARPFDPEPAESLDPGAIAYVMFTSGSTGSPKGAANTHAGIANRLLWMQHAYALGADDSVLHKTPATFDVSVWELFWPLIAGARLVVAEPGGHLDTGYLVDAVVTNEITVMHFVPSMLRLFLSDPGAHACTGLRRVIASGETLTADLRDLFFETLPASLHNLYGPTEAAIDVTYFDCVRGDADAVIPIGRPIANTGISILNEDMMPVPVGVPGELYIGGAGVARGYVNRPDLTRERFVEWSSAEGTTEIIYRTGDAARYRDDGTIEYLGRLDHQVKIRGVRIEPGEIEYALVHTGLVREAVVTTTGSAGESTLVAYFVPANPLNPPSFTDLRAALRRDLPEALIPARFLVLESIPTTSTGKRDLRSLPDPGRDRPDLKNEYQAPHSALEKSVAELWEQALGIDRVGVHDDFFELGGASTQIMEICAGARERGLPISPETLFRGRTVAAIAATIAEVEPESVATVPLPEEVSRTSTASVASDTARKLAGQQPDSSGTLIESIGVHLPDRVLSTSEILAGCDRPIDIPLEQLTGIVSRRVVGPGEFSFELAMGAAERCLAASRHRPEGIDLLICANISRVEGPDHRFVYEPSSAMRLRAALGLDNALSFDVSNACAGMFTGMWVADAFLRLGAVRTAMVVSGEYISHIIDTAQREIVDLLDDRLACLTVGDAGAAVILERGGDGRVGFHALELRSLSKYSDLCVGKRTDQPHGGAILYTKAVEQTAIAVRRSIPFAAEMMTRKGWTPESVDHVLMHQTSRSSINDATAAINRLAGRTAIHPDKVVCNLAERGNTASTTHIVAINDLIERKQLSRGDRMLFGVTGSGQTIGAALYTFDDLPDRMRHGNAEKVSPASDTAPGWPVDAIRVRIAAAASVSAEGEETAVELGFAAAAACLAESGVSLEDIGLLIYAGMLRDDHMIEPATATFLANRLRLNPDPEGHNDHGTFAFDIADGAAGPLEACQVAAAAMATGGPVAALVVAAEADPDHPSDLPARQRISHGGSAILLVRSESGSGFGHFRFTTYTEHVDALTTFALLSGDHRLARLRDPWLEDLYLKYLEVTVAEFLAAAGLAMADIAVLCGPQISAAFVGRLADRVGIARSRAIDVTDEAGDLFTSSLATALRRSEESGLARSGDIALVVTVGAGIRVGCATYHF